MFEQYLLLMVPFILVVVIGYDGAKFVIRPILGERLGRVSSDYH